MLNIDDRLLNELDESELYLVLHIAKHMKANRMTAWPSLEALSKACNWDDRTVKKHRQSLIKKGFLEMTMNPGKPTLYRFLKDGIGVYRPMKTDDPIAENEGTYIEGGTKNEGTQNAVNGVQKMRGVRGHKMYPEDIKGIKSEIIKEEGENAQNALSPPFSHVGTIESDEHVEIMLHLLEAEKKDPPPPGSGPTPPQEFLITTHTPQAPYIRLVEKIEIQDAPGPKSPGDITKPGRRSQAIPEIHPENIAAFDHFSDPEKCRALWSEWIEYKWGQHRDKYKTSKSELVMLRKLYTWSNGQAEIVSQIIEKSVGNLYKGLIDPNEKGNGTENRHDLNPAQRQHLTLAQYVAQRRIDAENRNAME